MNNNGQLKGIALVLMFSLFLVVGCVGPFVEDAEEGIVEEENVTEENIVENEEIPNDVFDESDEFDDDDDFEGELHLNE